MPPDIPTTYRRSSKLAVPASLPGAARRRKARRAARQRRLFYGLLLSLFSVALALSYPVLRAGQPPMADAGYPGPKSAIPWQVTSSPTPGGLSVAPARYPTGAPTSTASPTATPTPSPTPLPHELLVATAWQATLDQATLYSHATQTQVVIYYAATQTALPPLLTAMAAERSALATQDAAALER